MEKSTVRTVPNRKRASAKKRYLSAISIVGTLLLWLCAASVAQAQAPDPHDVQFDHVFD